MRLARAEANKIREEKRDVAKAATTIQAAWRGFWGFSHFVILQYEIVKLQAVVRGKLVRNNRNLKLGCAIMIQSTVRRYLAEREARQLRIARLMLLAKAENMRETLAAKRMQFWWRVVMECRREKEAALVIERFFLMVKAEVDREIHRVEMKKQSKKQNRRKKKKDSDDKLLERVWMKTVDDSDVDVFAFSPTESFGSRSHGSGRHRKSTSPKDSRLVKHRASSPTMNLVMRHDSDGQSERRTSPPTDTLAFAFSGEASDVSGITAPSLARRAMVARMKLHPEEAHVQHPPQGTRGSAEKYRKMYGIKTAPHSAVRGKHHFFADDLESLTSSIQGSRSGRRSISGAASTRNAATTPRTSAARHAKDPPAHHTTRVGHDRFASRITAPITDNAFQTDYFGEEFGMI